MAHATFEPNFSQFHFSFLVHSTLTYPPMKMEQTECSETLAYKLQMPGNYPKESIQHTEHGESLKSRKHP